MKQYIIFIIFITCSILTFGYACYTLGFDIGYRKGYNNGIKLKEWKMYNVDNDETRLINDLKAMGYKPIINWTK